ncbi:MAG TPA: terminase family protein, partial [Bryobacteraceae bacterium]
MQKQITLQLPAPHPAQCRLIQQAKRFNVVCCGRRWGKTVLGINRLIHPALQGKPVAWFAPNYRLLSDVWRELQTTLEPVVARLNQQERRLELHGGGVIEMWSLDSPDSGRGRAYAAVVIDEAAMAPNLELVWQSVRPMLTDWQGEAWFLSTPKGMNFFKVLFDRGQDPTRGDWASWQMATGDNPLIPPAEIEAARLDMTESAFNQEYLAWFVNWEGSVFRRVGEAATAIAGVGRETGHEYIIGCDWGRSNDFTVFLVLDAIAKAVVAIDRSHRVDYLLQCERLKALYEQWQPIQVIAEQNSIGQAIIEQLTREGL